MKAKCPNCDTSIQIPANAELNEILNCSDCESSLEITEMGKGVIKLEEIVIEEDWGE